MNPKLKEIHFMPWYTAETYDLCRSMCDDSADFFDTYDEWLVQANAWAKAVQDSGEVPVKALVDPIEFSKWCSSNGVRPNKETRSLFADIVARSNAVSG